MRYFLLVQGGCETINEQPYRSIDFAKIDTIGMSDITALNTGNLCGTECNSFSMEMDRPSTCHDCSKKIAEVVKEISDSPVHVHSILIFSSIWRRCKFIKKI